jgi:predicted lipid-binding transport protein (Tim44 family)
MVNIKSRRSRVLVALATVLTLSAGVVDMAEARPGGGKSFGSRGSRTFDEPTRTPTAPQARPIERTQTAPSTQAQRPGAPVGQAAQPASRFGGGLMGGLLGAGLLGMVLGAGFFGGLGGIASMLGFLLQVALIGGLIFLAVRFFRRRQEPAMAGAHARQAQGGQPYGGAPAGRQGLGGALGGLGGMGQARPQPAARPGQTDMVGIGPSDYAAFEQSLVEVQTAYGREDLNALRSLSTPEMGSYFAEELEANQARGVVNRVSDVKLEQGDLSEAWREDGADFATVAMRFSLKDATYDRATNRLVDGDETRPTEARELWTFRRERGGRWILSAIQQAG